jgi:colanic acid biosynthesis glycosyl transferase WcaI
MTVATVAMDVPAEVITIVCDFIPPDFGAVGQYMMERATQAAHNGGDACLIGLSRSGADDTSDDLGAGRLRVIRLDASAAPKGSLLTRGLWALKTNLGLIRATHRALRGRPRGDLLVTGSPPFLSSLVIVLNRLVWRQRLIYRITDFYPETVLATGQAGWLKLLSPIFKAIRRRADLIEVLGFDQQRRLIEDGVPADRIALLRDGSPVTITASTPPLRSPFGPDDKILLYSGNLGVAHPIETFCEAYRQHIQDGPNRVRLWMNGTGARVADLVAFCRTHNLPLHVTPPVDLDQLASVLVTPHAHLILLGDAFWGYVLPSKVYACLDSGKPVLFVGPAESDVALLLSERGAAGSRTVATVTACRDFLDSL